MYSSSNYLGGQGGRPVQPQHESTFQAQHAQLQQMQFVPQLTGIGNPQGQPIQPQMTGYPANQNQQLQTTPQQTPLYTGYPASFNGQHSFLGHQASGPSVQPKAMAQKPAATGFSQMAASFQKNPSNTTNTSLQVAKGTKIPNIRLSFISSKDQAQFETLFRSAVGDGQSMTGEKARDILLRSMLDGSSLSSIWQVTVDSLSV
jgi:hypothetical protein